MKHLRDADGKWIVRDQVQVSYKQKGKVRRGDIFELNASCLANEGGMFDLTGGMFDLTVRCTTNEGEMDGREQAQTLQF